MWRSMMPADGAVVACDGPDVVGMALFLDLRLTVPGGAVLPMAGVSWVAVAPTHRRRGALRGMFDELHARMTAKGYPLAGLEASEAGIYGRFGYGAATAGSPAATSGSITRMLFHLPLRNRNQKHTLMPMMCSVTNTQHQ